MLVVVVPLLLGSDNLHSGGESTTWDRIALALRSFWGVEQGGLLQPGTWNIDTNFPLGTALIFALPVALGLDPEPVLRLHSLLWMLVASASIFAMLRPVLGAALGAASASAMFWVPAVARGSVVTGEEAPTTGLLLLGLFGLSRAWKLGAEGAAKEQTPWLVLSACAVSGMVLFRLDAMMLPPAFALAGLVCLRGVRSWAYGLACGASSIAHLGITWALSGDPLDFARVATGVTESIATRQDVSTLDFAAAITGYLGGGALVLAALTGLVLSCAVSTSRELRLIAWLTLWTTAGYLVAARVPVLELDLARYFVPLLSLLALFVPLVGLAAGHRGALRSALALAGLVLLSTANLETIRAENQAARLEPGLVEVSEWLRICAPDIPTASTHRAPALQLSSGLRQAPVHLLGSRWNTVAPRPMGDELNEHGAKLLVLVGAGPEVQEFRASKIHDWSFVWQESEVVVYGRVPSEVRTELQSCGEKLQSS